MKITTTNLFTIIEADEGMILIDPEGYGATKIYLGIYDSPNNYLEIPVDEYEEPNPEEPYVESVERTIQRLLREEVNK